MAIPFTLNAAQHGDVLSLVRSVGDYVRSRQGEVIANAELSSIKSDGSVVTEVDKAASHRLIEGLERITGLHVLTEESTGQIEQMRDAQNTGTPLWIIDPIDGTASYREGYDEYAVNVGLLVPDANGEMQPEIGFVYFPSKNQLLFTDRFGHASLLNTADESLRKLQPKTTLADGEALSVSIGYRKGDDAMTSPFADCGLPLAQERHTGPMRAARVLLGDCHASVMGVGVSIWDTCGLHAVARAAGAIFLPYDTTTKTLTGEPMYYGADSSKHYKQYPLANPPYLCADPALLKQLGVEVPNHFIQSSMNR